MFTLPRKIPAQDLLDDWLKQVQLKNSVFARQRSIVVTYGSLIALRDYFTEFFGAEFFQFEEWELKTVSLRIKDSNWFFQLLANDDYPSLVHLYELARLLQTSEAHHPALHKVLQSNSGNQAFRNYLFEAVIYEMLRINNVSYQTKPIVNGKEKEGFV